MFDGHVHPDFWVVARQLRRLIPSDGRGGAAVCVYHRGECVADLVAGTRDARGRPWTPDTLAISFSTTKGVLATLVHVLVDRGVLGYDRPIAEYWPEFAREGKQAVTVRQLLCHEAGLWRIGEMIDSAERMLDWSYMVRALEASRPAHAPGAAHGYHGLTFGWLVAELVQRASGRPLAALLDEQLARPLGAADLYVGLPASVRGRCAELVNGRLLQGRDGRSRVRRHTRWLGRGLRAAGASLDLSELEAALMPAGIEALDFNDPALLAAVMPSVNGLFSARSLARLYAALAGGGELDGVRLLSATTLEQATRVHNQGIGRVVPLPMHWRLGYHRIPTVRVKAPRAFGHFGVGGSGAFADPDRELAVALMVNSGPAMPFGDTRIVRVASAAIQAADRRTGVAGD